MLSVLYLDIIGIKGSPTLKQGRKCQPSLGPWGWSEVHCGRELALGTHLWWTFPFNPLRVSKHSVMGMADLVCAGHIKIMMVMLRMILC